MDLGLREKVALVTGASKGLGKAIAEEFAEEGAHVSICARGKADLEKTAAELRVHGVKVVATSGDAARNDDVQRVIDETIKHLGAIAWKSISTAQFASRAGSFPKCVGKAAAALSICQL